MKITTQPTNLFFALLTI